MGAWGGRKSRRGAIQRGHDLAPHVDSRIIVVAELWRAHAETYEHDLALNLAVGGKRIASHHVIFVENEGPYRPVVFQGDQALVFQEFDLAEADPLEVCSVPSPRLQTHFLELRPNIVGRQLIAARSGTPAFQQIVRQKGHMRPQALGSDALQEPSGGKSEEVAGKGEGNHQHKTQQHDKRLQRQTRLPGATAACAATVCSARWL